MDFVIAVAQVVGASLLLCALILAATYAYDRVASKVQLARQRRAYETPYEREVRKERRALDRRPEARLRNLNTEEEAAVRRAREFLNRD